MREIKFRAWDKVAQSMRLGAEHSLTMCLMNPNDFKVMQYTGLKDKNGVEIYESDVLKQGELIYQCYWDKQQCGWNIGKLNAEISEVIGNIYENKELLK